MKTVLGVENPGAAAVSPRKLNRRFYTFAAAAPEVNFFQPPAGQLAQTAGELPGNFRHVALQHCRAALVHFVFQRLNHVRMVVPDIVDAVAGQKIQNATTVLGVKLATKESIILALSADCM